MRGAEASWVMPGTNAMSAPSSAGGVGPGRDGAAGLTCGDAADCAADGTGVGIAAWAGGCAVSVTERDADSTGRPGAMTADVAGAAVGASAPGAVARASTISEPATLSCQPWKRPEPSNSGVK